MTPADRIAALDATSRKSRIDFEGRSVQWRRFGDGPPIVLLHGGHGSWLHWIRNIEPLSRRFTVCVPDMPGFGQSDDPTDGATSTERLARLVDQLVGSLDGLLGGRVPIGLAGFSFGGLVSAHVTARRGDVRRLALLGSGGHGTPRRAMRPMRQWRVDDRAEMEAALHNNLLALMVHDPAQADDLAMAIHEYSCLNTRFRSKEISTGSGLGPTLSKHGDPAMAIWGEHDITATPTLAGPNFAASGPSREFRIVPDAGHWVQFEKPALINAALMDWFAPG